MAWKKEYAEARKAKASADPEYRAKRNAQAAPKDKAARAEYMAAYYSANPEKFKRSPEQQAKINARKREQYAQNAQMREAARAAAKATMSASVFAAFTAGSTTMDFTAALEAAMRSAPPDVVCIRK